MELPLIFSLILLFVSGLVSSSFERGDRYWNGKPQPIGIDFSASHVIAVYANGTGNFTTLAIVGHLPGNEYGEYMAAKFASIKDWGNDDLLIEDLYDDPPEAPSQQALDQVSEWLNDLGSWSCKKLTPMLESPSFNKLCFPDTTFSPQRPKSRYQYLHTELRLQRLRSIAPKWFRNPQPRAMTKAKLITDILEYLEHVKSISLADHGIAITSATISKPPWAQDFDDAFDEACLLAGIETFEQPQDRVSMATKGFTEDVGPALVLDHGQYHFNVHKSAWDERDKQYAQRGSMGRDGLGTLWIVRELANKVLRAYNQNVTEEERRWASKMSGHVILTQVLNARLQINFRGDWPEDLEYENRTVAVNLTDRLGFTRVWNVTGEDVQEVERAYVGALRGAVEQSILKHLEIHEYMRSLPNYDEIKDLSYEKHRSVQDDIVANVTAPEHIGSWVEHVERFLILDTGTEAALLYEAANLAIKKNSFPEKEDRRTCVPTIETAARGLALRASDWVGFWEGWEREKLYWQKFDEDDPATWESEDGESEEDSEEESEPESDSGAWEEL